MPDVRIAYRPFPDQQAYFRRKVNFPSARWDDLQHGEHAHGFMAAGVARADVLEDLRQAVQAAIDNGEGFDAFRKRFDAIVAAKGWIGGAGNESAARRAWRTRVIYQTNLRTSYMAGRWETLKGFPYMRYQHHTVVHPRLDHLAWDGLVLATTNPWWDIHYPPNGWGCRCTVTGVGKGRLRALGKDGPDPTPAAVEGDPPPEWAYHPGKVARSLSNANALGRKVMALPAAWRKIALDDAQRRAINWMAPQWRDILDAAELQGRAGGRMHAVQHRGAPVGFFTSDVVAALESGQGQHLAAPGRERLFHAFTPRSATITAGDAFLAHTIRDVGAANMDAVKAAIIEVPARLADPHTAWLFDPTDGETLIAAWPDGGGAFWKLIVGNRQRQMNRERIRGYHLITLERRTREQLQGYILLAGTL